MCIRDSNYIESYLDNELKKHNEETAKLIADEVDEDIYYDHIFNTCLLYTSRCV